MINLLIFLILFTASFEVVSSSYCQSLSLSINCKETIIHDDKMKRDFAVVTVFPEEYDDRKSYPIFLVSDVQRNLHMAVAAKRALEGAVNDFIIVGVGTPWGGDAHIRRMYEFSLPFKYYSETLKGTMLNICRSNDLENIEHCVGGAADFSHFLNGTIISNLKKNLKIEKNGLTFFGSSAGGFFSLADLFLFSGKFDNYIATSPAFGMGKSRILNAAKSGDFKNKKLFIGYGTLEADSEYLAKEALVISGFNCFLNVVNENSTLKDSVIYYVEYGFGHGDVVSPIMIKAMRSLYSLD